MRICIFVCHTFKSSLMFMKFLKKYGTQFKSWAMYATSKVHHETKLFMSYNVCVSCLYVCFWFILQCCRYQGYVVRNDKMIDGWWIGKNLDGNDLGLIGYCPGMWRGWNLGQDSWCLDRDSYQSYPEYKCGMSTFTRARAWLHKRMYFSQLLFGLYNIYLFVILICYAHEVILCLWCISHTKIHPPPDYKEGGHYQVRAIES
jgi:hypothetical protein